MCPILYFWKIGIFIIHIECMKQELLQEFYVINDEKGINNHKNQTWAVKILLLSDRLLLIAKL